ncbi:coiled-coil domain-containing protein 137 [Gastrophryne carolinensis]
MVSSLNGNSRQKYGIRTTHQVCAHVVMYLMHCNVKKKTNSKPKDLDAQEIPFKLREIMRSRMEMNKPKKKKKPPPPPARKPGPGSAAQQTDIPVPKFRRGKSESEYGFLTRMNRETELVMFLSKNQAERLPEMELDLGRDALPDEGAKKNKSDKKREFDRRRLDKFYKKKEERKALRLEEEMFKDRVAFGEVAMEPPSLTAQPKKSVATVKPGQKQLLLKKLLDGGGGAGNAPPISMARKRMVEEERERVVQAYRDLKKRKHEAEVKRPKPRRT